MVKARRIKDGQYELSYRGQVVAANRRPDLYFEIVLGGQTLPKGYLHQLKKAFQAHVDGEPLPTKLQAKAAAPAAPAGPPSAELSHMLADLKAGYYHRDPSEWERDFIERLAARPKDRPLTDWQIAQLACTYRGLGGYHKEKK